MQTDKILFTQFEKEESLFERTYNGIPYWQMLRFMVCEDVCSDYIEKEDVVRAKNRKKNIVLQLIRYPYECVKMVIYLRKIENCDVLCFRNMMKGSVMDRFFDTWNMPSEIKKQTIDISLESADLAYPYNIMVPYFRAQIKYAMKKLFSVQKRDEKEYAFLKKLELKLEYRFGRKVSADRMEHEIIHWLEIDSIFVPFYEKLFEKTNCKAVVVDCYYNNFLYSAYRVARKKGIRIIEFQHGAISAHPQYWFEDQRGLNNYTPDYCLTFGMAHSTWTKMLPTTRAVAVGFPYQENQIDKWKNLQTEEKTVVIYPQALPEFEVVVAQFAEIMGERGYRIILKLHPSQAENYSLYYPLLSKNKELEVITNQDKGIYYWLKLARHHVVSNTTVGLEAVAMAHTNICVATNIPHAQTQPLLDWGVASSFTNAAELIELVENPPQRDTTKERSALWKPNGEKNIQDFFSRLKAQNWPEGQRYVE